MSGPNPPGPDSEGSDNPEREPGDQVAEGHRPGCRRAETDIHSQAYSAPESEQFTSGPYVPADPGLYDYDDYDAATELVDAARPPRWPWVVGVAAIIAAVSLVVSVSLLVTGTDSRQPRDAGNEHDDVAAAGAGRDHHHDPASTAPAAAATGGRAAASATGDRHGDAGAAAPASAARGSRRRLRRSRPPPRRAPPPTSTTRSGPRQVTYSVTGTKAPGDIITVTYVDASGRSRTQRNVYIPWSLTVTPISQSEVGSVQASSLFLVSRLNCSITTSDGTVLSSNTGNAAQTSC